MVALETLHEFVRRWLDYWTTLWVHYDRIQGCVYYTLQTIQGESSQCDMLLGVCLARKAELAHRDRNLGR